MDEEIRPRKITKMVAVVALYEIIEAGRAAKQSGLAGVDGGHLSPDGIHVLAQGSSVLLRLVPIGDEVGSECMDLVGKGLGRTRGDLRVAVH